MPPARRGLRSIDPALQGLAVGDVVPDWGGADATFTVPVEPASHLLYTSTRGRTHLTWCLRVDPRERPPGAGSTSGCGSRRSSTSGSPRWSAGAFDLATVAGLAAGGLRGRCRGASRSPGDSAQRGELAPQHPPLALVPAEADRELELAPRLVAPAEPGEQLAADARQQVRARAARRRRRSSSTIGSAAAGPVAIATATARLSSTTGDGASRPSAS